MSIAIKKVKHEVGAPLLKLKEMMKKIIGIIALSLAGSLYAQQKETVHSIIVVRHELGWYETQMNLWEKEVKAHPKDVDAWLNYYTATRMIRLLSEPGSENHKKYLEKCEVIAKNAYSNIPETFEGNYIMSWNLIGSNGSNEARLNYLLKAHTINPDDARIYDALLSLYEINGNQEKVEEFGKKLYDANSYPPGLLYWAYNILASVEKNAIIFSNGDNNTFPLWVVQYGLNFRKDVTVLNTYLLKEPDYCQRKCAKLGLASFKYDIILDNSEEMYFHFLNNDQGIPVYSTNALSEWSEINNISNNLYDTGLAYKYCKQNFDNLSVIRRNYEKVFVLDYLKVKVSTHVADERATYFDSFYLGSMIKLYNHYKLTEETDKMNEIYSLLMLIAERNGRLDEIKSYL